MMHDTLGTSVVITVPARTVAQMLEVDRVAVQAFGVGVMQIMENAGSILLEPHGAMPPRD